MEKSILKYLDLDRKPMNVVEALKEEKLPLVMWGCGDVGNTVENYLRDNGIIIDDVFIDVKADNIDFDGYKVLSLQQVLDKYEKFNLILGHSSYKKGEKLAEEVENISNVFMIPSVFYNQCENIKADFIIENEEAYNRTFNLLEDDYSRECMAAYLNTRVNGDMKYIYPLSKEEITYFKNDIFSLDNNQVFVDVGAFDGDTIREFVMDMNRKYSKIIAFEPGDESFEGLKDYIEKDNLNNVTCIKQGTWNKKEVLKFAADDKSFSITDGCGEISCPVDKIDNLVDKYPELDEITIMKVNFYSGVLETLQGAKELIKRRKPRFAIVVGFDGNALINIPQYIKQIVPEYKCYLRFNRAMPACLTLYAEV